MVRVKTTPEVLGDINPTELQLACAAVRKAMEDHPDPLRLRARRKWLEVVQVPNGNARDRYAAGCAIRYEGKEWFVDVTTIRKQQGQRGNPRARGRA